MSRNDKKFNKGQGTDRDESRDFNKSNSKANRRTKGTGQRQARARGFHDSERSQPMSGNHDSWWCKYDQLTKDAASFSFDLPVGSRMPSFEHGQDNFTPAGIMVLNYVPCLGTVRSSHDPINVAARMLYDIINAKNSRNASYDPSDLMIYVLAVANAWAFHRWIIRAIGLMLTYSVTNRYIPDALLKAMGFEPTNAQNTISKWRDIANWLAIQLNKFPVPKGIDYFARAEFMCSDVYLDDPGEKASMYLFNPEGFFVLHEPDESNDTYYLKIEKLVGTGTDGLYTPQDVENYGKKITDSISNHTDLDTMCADIIKAFGRENCYSKGEVNESYVTIPTYNPDIMPQIHNARTFLPTSQFYDKYAIKQNMESNCLTSTLSTSLSANSVIWSFHRDKYLPLDMPMIGPTVQQVMKATRLMWHIGEDKSTVEPVCTELLTSIDLFKFADDGTGGWELAEYGLSTDLRVSPSTTWEVIQQISDYNKFMGAPMLHVHYFEESTSDPSQYTGSRMISDIQNYNVLSKHELATLHNNGLISLFSPFGSAGK